MMSEEALALNWISGARRTELGRSAALAGCCGQMIGGGEGMQAVSRRRLIGFEIDLSKSEKD
jgi:hypothetical protein